MTASLLAGLLDRRIGLRGEVCVVTAVYAMVDAPTAPQISAMYQTLRSPGAAPPTR